MCNAAVPTSSCSIAYICFVPAGQNRLLALNYIYPGEDPAVCAAHVEWGAAFQAQFAQDVLPEVTPAQRNTTPGRPLRVRRVGLVCNVCVVGAWLAAVFMHACHPSACHIRAAGGWAPISAPVSCIDSRSFSGQLSDCTGCSLRHRRLTCPFAAVTLACHMHMPFCDVASHESWT